MPTFTSAGVSPSGRGAASTVGAALSTAINASAIAINIVRCRWICVRGALRGITGVCIELIICGLLGQQAESALVVLCKSR